jgi:hypothetical protein
MQLYKMLAVYQSVNVVRCCVTPNVRENVLIQNMFQKLEKIVIKCNIVTINRIAAQMI